MVTECISAGQVVTALDLAGFPLERLKEWPVSSIESSTAIVGDMVRSYCAVRCLGCCTDSVAADETQSGAIHMTPQLLAGVLAIVEEFGRRGVRALSTVRLSLYSGSNELDSRYCVQLREMLSQHLQQVFGFPLGCVSSDLAFHISGSPVFRRNLEQLLERPSLWDNICLSVDEQIPFQNRAHYEKFREHLSWVWETLRPVTLGDIVHPIEARKGTPRLILNMLVPGEGSCFRAEHRLLYPGGPARATEFGELAERYIRPFAGDLVVLSEERPKGHQFTTGIARLSRVPGSSVYVAAGRYALTGRGRKLVVPGIDIPTPAGKTIKIKILPVGPSHFQFRACFTANLGAEDELEVPDSGIPDWFRSINHCIIDVSKLEAYQERSVLPA